MDIAVATGQALPEEARPQEDFDVDVQVEQRSAASAYPYGGASIAVQLGQGTVRRGQSAPQELIDFQSTNIYQEWRTPPLWGVQDSAPYLHDGRAASLAEAIVMHGGEAAPSAANFVALDYISRRALLEFLGTLRSPFYEPQ